MKYKLNYKRFFKIVITSVLLFCLISALIITGVFFIQPDLLKNTPYFGKFIPTSSDKPINILLLGKDATSENTDVIILVHFDPQTKDLSLLSIPRDTKVYYPERTPHKINALHHLGVSKKLGANLVKQKVGELIGQEVDYAIVADPKGFRNIIDILDGVEVDVPRNMDYDDYDQNLHIHLKKGLQMLNGKKAEHFVRYRHDYIDGDLGRIDAQKIFFKAFAEQKLKPQYILKANSILKEVFSNIEDTTDMNVEDAIKYALHARDLKTESIKFLTLPGEPKKERSAWYYISDHSASIKIGTDDFSPKIIKTNNELK